MMIASARAEVINEDNKRLLLLRIRILITTVAR
jgi:hypothetical protein